LAPLSFVVRPHGKHIPSFTRISSYTTRPSSISRLRSSAVPVVPDDDVARSTAIKGKISAPLPPEAHMGYVPPDNDDDEEEEEEEEEGEEDLTDFSEDVDFTDDPNWRGVNTPMAEVSSSNKSGY
jgi:hypothetical protein